MEPVFVADPHFRQVSALLSSDECASIIDAARPWLRPCTPIVDPLTRDGGIGVVAAATRIACLPDEEAFPGEFVEIAAFLRQLIADLSGLPETHQELFQVVHQIETPSVDPEHGVLAPGWEFLKFESESGGERIFSFILYLNDVDDGGESDCPHGIRVRPEAGKAAFWHNPPQNPGYGRGLHASHPVTRGEKWALACWAREGPCRRPSATEIDAVARTGGWNVEPILRRAARIKPPAWIVRRTHDQQARTPYLGAGGPQCRGVERRALDAGLFADIRAKYASVQHRLRPETDPAIGTFLRTVSREAPPALFHDDAAYNGDLLERLRPLHEEWCGLPLAPSACYGFRVYLPGAYLHDHVDAENTHIISSAICVDKDVRAAWPLHVVDIDGQELDLELAPGELVLYESARILHGRPTPLKGRFHVGLFLHYRPLAG